jgi:hypothetical protein
MIVLEMKSKKKKKKILRTKAQLVPVLFFFEVGIFIWTIPLQYPFTVVYETNSKLQILLLYHNGIRI